MKNRYFERLDVLQGQPFSLYLPLQVQPIVNGENGEPRDIEAKDVENLHVYLRNVGETGRGKSIPFETLYNYVVVKVPAQMRKGEMSLVIVGNYGQVCLRAEIVANIGKRGGLGGILRPYVSPVVGDCGTIADIAPLPLCFTNHGDRAVGLGFLVRNGDEDDPEWHPNLEFSYNGDDWHNVTDEEFFDEEFPVTLAAGHSVYLRGNNPNGFNQDDDYTGEVSKYMAFRWSNDETEVSVSGDIASLVNYEKRVSEFTPRCFTFLFSNADEELEFMPITNAGELIILSVDVCAFYRLFDQCQYLVNAPALPAKTLAESCYSGMFGGCTSLVNAPALPAKTLAESCYQSMFGGCTSLVNAPALPATTLTWYCYNSMFNGCTSLVNAPALPATTLAESCYSRMFGGCTSLVNAPALPATTLVSYCYNNMFNGCTSLVNAPALPATTLAGHCYNNMFNGCTSLVNAPALPATTLAVDCYQSMFGGCTSLVNAPALPAKTLAVDCYKSMFGGCTSLVNAPALPATTLAGYCYNNMFNGCTSLVNAPALPATTLTGSCYAGMFGGCTSLVNAPALPATTLVSYCYQLMFYGCSSLRNIEMLAYTLSPTIAVTNWVQGVPTGHAGTFVKNANATWTTTGNSGVPTGWGVTYKQV